MAGTSLPVHDISESEEDSDATVEPDLTELGNHSPDLFGDNSDVLSSKDNTKSSNNSQEFSDKGMADGARVRDSVRLDKKTSSKSDLDDETVILGKEETIHICDANKNDNAKRKKLPPCRYGSKCYRKNPSHFEEFSHSAEDEPSTSEKTSLPRKKTRVHSPTTVSPAAGLQTFTEAQPFSFFLTKVTGIDKKYNSSYTMHIKDILSPSMGNLTASCQFNYMFEISWLARQYPSEFRKKPLLLVHGFQGANKSHLEADAMSHDHIRFCQARLEMTYGTHHTKMMFLLYDNGLRVVIHTANLIERDWFQKTQGIWISPVFPKLAKSSAKDGDSKTRFKHDLLEYVSAYRAYQLKDWIKHIEDHDMSAARVHIIGSVPGRHTGERKHCFGHLKLRKVLQEHGPDLDTVKSWPVIGQFSSIGSLGPTKDSWCRDWLQSLSSGKSSANKLVPGTKLILIFPSKDNVRLSLEGYPAGQSIPYSINNAKKQTYIHDHFVQWSSLSRGRDQAMPHIKTYMRPSPDSKRTAWFCLTSANLSKAAWGALEKNSVQLMIRSYEIGVLFLPGQFGLGGSFSVSGDVDEIKKSHRPVFPLPYDLPPIAYTKQDRPWMWDISYKDLPDSHGNIWCPD